MRRMLTILALALIAALAIGTATVMARDGSDDNGDGHDHAAACTATHDDSGRDGKVAFRHGADDGSTTGDDDINGEAGDDDVSGDRGDDEIDGDRGDDHLRGDRGDDDLCGDQGDDDLN